MNTLEKTLSDLQTLLKEKMNQRNDLMAVLGLLMSQENLPYFDKSLPQALRLEIRTLNSEVQSAQVQMEEIDTLVLRLKQTDTQLLEIQKDKNRAAKAVDKALPELARMAWESFQRSPMIWSAHTSAFDTLEEVKKEMQVLTDKRSADEVENTKSIWSTFKQGFKNAFYFVNEKIVGTRIPEAALLAGRKLMEQGAFDQPEITQSLGTVDENKFLEELRNNRTRIQFLSQQTLDLENLKTDLLEELKAKDPTGQPTKLLSVLDKEIRAKIQQMNKSQMELSSRFLAEVPDKEQRSQLKTQPLKETLGKLEEHNLTIVGVEKKIAKTRLTLDVQRLEKATQSLAHHRERLLQELAELESRITANEQTISEKKEELKD